MLTRSAANPVHRRDEPEAAARQGLDETRIVRRVAERIAQLSNGRA